MPLLRFLFLKYTRISPDYSPTQGWRWQTLKVLIKKKKKSVWVVHDIERSDYFHELIS